MPPSPPDRHGEATGNAPHLRRINLERILSIGIARATPFTRTELVAATGLSAPTVSSLASSLLQAGLFRDLGRGPSRGGRRPAFMEFNSRCGFVAAIDLGPMRTRLAVADVRGQRISDRIIPTPAGDGPKAGLARLVRALRDLIGDTRVPLDQVLAIGVAAPGIVDRERGVMALAPNLEGWTQVPMREILERDLGVPVVVENDVNLAVLAEHGRGAARGFDTCAFILMGTGIGAGILVNGRLLRGRHSMAGEIAVMCMGPQFIEQDFGTKGCLESLAGLQALAARWPQGAKGDPADWMEKLFAASGRGERSARAAIEETATLLGMATANLAAVLDPAVIVLGGALITLGPSFVEEVRKVATRLARAPLEIRMAALGKEAPMWGALLVAAEEARSRLLRSPRKPRPAAAEPAPVLAARSAGGRG